jgi:PAS domain S-box-containing protein
MMLFRRRCSLFVTKEIRILILEDVAADVVRMNHELRQAGLNFRSKRVDTRADFLNELQHHPPDVILSDHGLPSFDGFTALAIARDQCPNVPFIFVTGSVGGEVAIETFKSGAADYVLKEHLGDLAPAIQRALREAEGRARREESDTELRGNEELFRLVMDGVKDYAIFMLDKEGRVIFWNAGAQLLYGWQADEVRGRNFSIFYTDEDVARGKPRLALKTALAEGRFAEEGIRVGKGGEKFTANIVIISVRNGKGKMRGFTQVTRDITGRRRAEEDLRKSNSLKTFILETALDAIILIDSEGKIQEWNPATHKIFGYTREQALGKSPDDLIVPRRVWEIYHDGLTQYLMTGVGSLIGRPIELMLKRADGREFAAELSISRNLLEDPPRCTAIVRDITERKLAETALRESEEHYRMLVEEVKDYAICMLNPEGVVTSWNTGAERIKGYRAEEIIGKPYDVFFTPEDIQHSLPVQLLKRAEREGQAFYEGPRVRKNGEKFWGEGSITALRGDHGRLRGFSKVTRDISERRRTEEQLKASLKEIGDLKAALDEHAIVAITDPEGKITYVNDKFCSISKYSREELLGQDHRIVNSGFHPKAFIRDLWHTITHGRVWHGEIKNKARDGSFYWVDTTIVPFLNEDGKPRQYVAIRADITERMLAVEKVHQLNEELEHRVVRRTAQLETANKDLEAFSYSISHDLRAPLLRISGFADILQDEAAEKLDETSLKHLRTIAEGTQQMSRLIDALLDFSRMGREEMRQAKVIASRLVEEARHELSREIEGRDIEWNIGELPEVRGDPIMLRQVFVNLISNAVKYSRPRQPAKIEIGAKAEPGEIVFFIRDNGVGFDVKYAGRLFGVFQRLHPPREFEGTGIGLANVQRILRRHGGRIWAESELDKGATFYFSLPAQPNEVLYE